VVAGTASAVNGRVQRRQAEKFADRDARTASQREQAYYAQQPPPPPPQYAQQQYAAPAPPPPDPIQQLKDLASLRDQGVLTEEEFAAQKAKILG
jgi:hypothetical protein